MTAICLLNQSKTDLGVHLDDLAAALQFQNTRDVVPAWGCPVTFSTAASDGTTPAGAYVMRFTDAKPPEAGAEGDHDVDANGNPVLNIWVTAILQAGDSVSVTASHEAIEEPADPFCVLCAQDEHSGWFWPIEPCDAVETETYKVNGVDVSNFVLPAYFRRPAPHERVDRFDFMGLLKSPFTIAGGGYSSVWKRNRWATVWGPDQARAMERHANLPKARKRRRQSIVLAGGDE